MHGRKNNYSLHEKVCAKKEKQCSTFVYVFNPISFATETSMKTRDICTTSMDNLVAFCVPIRSVSGLLASYKESVLLALFLCRLPPFLRGSCRLFGVEEFSDLLCGGFVLFAYHDCQAGYRRLQVLHDWFKPDEQVGRNSDREPDVRYERDQFFQRFHPLVRKEGSRVRWLPVFVRLTLTESAPPHGRQSALLPSFPTH